MKILLINSYQRIPVHGANYPINTFQPLGLAYIANVLLKQGYQVAILDALAEGFDHEEIHGEYKYVGLPETEIKKRIINYHPDIIGVSMPFTAQAVSNHNLARLIKKINKNIIIVAGGSYPTTYPKEILQDQNIDFLIRGEGENVFKDLVAEILAKNHRYDSIQGLVYRTSTGIKINHRQPLLENLDNYLPAWDLLPMEKYYQAACKVKSSRSMSTYGKRWATIFTSRGCPFRCTFCVGHEVMGRLWRPRSTDNVISEMEMLINKYHIKHFDIEDDNFTLDKNRAKDICRKIINNNWGIQWSTPNGIRADTVDEELVMLMKQSGCVRTIIAPESGDQTVVDNLMNKRINLVKVKNVVRWCQKYGLAIDGFFLLGIPGEKEENILKTINYARKLRKIGMDECLFGIVVPHKGTKVYETVIKNDWLKLPPHDHCLIESLAHEEALIETPYLSIMQLKNLQKTANRVNAIIPLSRFKLIFRLAVKTPFRFSKLLLSFLGKRLGLVSGKIGT